MGAVSKFNLAAVGNAVRVGPANSGRTEEEGEHPVPGPSVIGVFVARLRAPENFGGDVPRLRFRSLFSRSTLSPARCRRQVIFRADVAGCGQAWVGRWSGKVGAPSIYPRWPVIDGGKDGIGPSDWEGGLRGRGPMLAIFPPAFIGRPWAPSGMN